MLPRETCWLLWMLYMTTTYLTHIGGQDCRFIYNNSLLSTVSHGIFHSERYPQNYPKGKRCMYIFVGKPDERVQMKFTVFNVQGVAPLCQFDYLDIYAEVTDTGVTDLKKTLIDTPLLGRFCGDGINKRLPKLIVSMSNVIVLDFYSDSDKADTGFEGEYKFIDSSIYNIGHKKSVCDYTINSIDSVSGYIVSPTYPGMYPDNLHCTYTLEGKIGQRIRIGFQDFSLFHGGDYCPVDYLSVVDGIGPAAEEIGRFCGNYKNVVIYSTEQYLKIVFQTLSGRIDTVHADNLEGDADFLYNRRGFNITYQFSDHFAWPTVSSRNNLNVQHIKGTACDVRIKSGRLTSGTLLSPGYPQFKLPPNVTCNYYLDGMKNSKVLEKVQISFQDFDIPGGMPYCNSGYLAVNLVGSQGVGHVNERYCGSLLPPNLTSEDSRMIMTLDTHGVQNSRGFSSSYQFITDFGIPGHSPEDGKCIFLYTSSQRLQDGTFNSPYYPANYPDSTKCEYIFRPAASERLLISFYAFNLGIASSCVSADNIVIDQHNAMGNLSRVNTYCGVSFPGPIVGELGKEMRVVFNSRRNSRKEGFNARFEFLNGRLKKCGSKIVSFGGGGLIKSPDYPEKYKSYSYCNWVIMASKPQNQILVVFDYFHIEGKPGQPNGDGGEGCKNAVMRVYQDLNQPGKELCGQQQGQFFLSIGQYMKLEFITSSGALGAKGFKITWTEVHETKGPCPMFTCKVTKYCIDNSLKCNGFPNCGHLDNSDEEMGCPSATVTVEPVVADQLGPQRGKFEVLHIAVGASISSFFCIILVVCGFYHRKRFRYNNNPKPPDNQVEVRYVAASSSNNTGDRLLAVDHTDTNGSHKGSHVSVGINITNKYGTPNQVHKPLSNPSVEKISQCSSQSSSYSPSVTSNQSPKIASIHQSRSRTPRIQKVSIV